MPASRAELDWVRSPRPSVNVVIMDPDPQQPHRIRLRRFCKQQRWLRRRVDSTQQLWTGVQQHWRRMVCRFPLVILLID